MTATANQVTGHWRSTVTESNMPKGELEWKGMPRRAYTALLGGQVVATIRRSRYGGWVTKIDGWNWILPEGGQSVASKLGVKESDSFLFESSPSAREAVENAFKQLPWLQASASSN